MPSTFPFPGLTSDQAAQRLGQFGPNELPRAKAEAFWHRILKTLQEPMLLLLIAASAIYLIMGDLGEGLMLGASVFFVIGISFYQERRSEKALAALRDLSSPRALVIREGQEMRVAANLLVPGDLVALHEGDRIPADGYVLQSSNFSVDESLLTGESFPVKKQQTRDDLPQEQFANQDNLAKVFSSTLVISGTAFFRVAHTGISTEVGKIGRSLQEVEPEELNLTKEVRQIVRLFAWSGSLLCIGIIILYGTAHKDWLKAFLVGLATQMSLLPEEFPVVLTIFLAMGAWRLSKLQVLVRQPGSIERLGAVTVLCVDKTGTLTQNRMSVAALNNTKRTQFLYAEDRKQLLEEFHSVAEFGVLASHQDPFDPMEKAIRFLLEEGDWGKPHLHKDWVLIRDYPLSDKLLAMSCVWKSADSDSFVIAAKGAPEAIASLCHLSSDELQNVNSSTKEMALNGLRVLGVAKASFSSQNLPDDQHDFSFTWLGLIGLEDPLRPEVPNAVQLCRDAGIRVVMMTGDYPETALKIAGKAGIETQNALVTGNDLTQLSEDELTLRLKQAHIFARMVPEQKLRVVKLLKKMGHVVAMTGDGVNDAPSLKWADIGISMGARGTDVAREASDIVLLDDNFSSIVAGIERGRLIFTNIKKSMSYLISVHVPIAGLSILPALFNWPLILMPIHIVFLELIIDPACSLMFESQPGEANAMKSPPRSLSKRLFSLRDMLRSFLQGTLVLGVILAVLWITKEIPHGNPNRARTFAFVILILSNMGLILADVTNGSLRQLKATMGIRINKLLLLSVAIGLLLVTQIKSIQALFNFEPLSINETTMCVGASMLVFTLIALWNRRAQH